MAHNVRSAHSQAASAWTEPLDWEQVDDEDAFLLSDDLASEAGAGIEAQGQGLAKAQAQAANVTWLRRTEYLSAEQRKQRGADAKHATPQLDTSRPAQIERIEQGFAAANTPLSSLSHPSKPGVHAVDAYEVLPDPETWATSFQIIRFAGVLGRSAKGEPALDPRMGAALLRPVTDPLTGQQRVSLYLTCADTLPPYAPGEEEAPPSDDWDEATQQQREDLGAARFRKRRRLGVFPEVPWLDGAAAEGDSNVYGTGFRHVRDLEPVDQPGPTDHLLAIVLDDQQPDAAPDLVRVDVDQTLAQSMQHDDLFEADESPDVDTTLPPQSARERERQHVVTPASEGRKVAYYHPIDMRYGLRLRRTRKAEQRLLVPYEGFWHRIIVGHRPLTEREMARRLVMREAVDALDMEGVEYVESEDEGEEEAAEDAPAEEAAAAAEDAPAEDAATAAEDVPAEDTATAAEDAPAEEEAASDTDSDEAALDIDADELADLQAEADAHDDSMPTGRRRRHEASD